MIPERQVEKKFTAIKKLGHGAQAIVYQAKYEFESDLEETFALKVFNEGRMNGRDCFEQEVAVHQILDGNPNILKLIDHSVSQATVSVPRNIPEHENDQFA